eukprot:m.971104 g.971104  ORF g.971104 m.971104 type:complete len:571 (-) comp23926_c0_seq9:3608-5320(-)
MAGYPGQQGYGYPQQQYPMGGQFPPQPQAGFAYSQPRPSGAPPPVAFDATPCSKIILRLHARDIVKLDLRSQSDPMCEVQINSLHTGNTWVSLGKTERVKNAKDPDFATTFELDYFFEEKQMLRFILVDSDGKGAGDAIGQVETSLGEIVGAGCGNFTREIVHGGKKGRGKLHVSAEEISANKGIIRLQFRASKCDKKDFFGKSDPFLTLASLMPNGTHAVFHKTEVIKNNLNPTWRQFEIPVTVFCAGDYDREIQIACYDWDSDGSHDLIGTTTTTLNELQQGQRNEWDLLNPKKLPGGRKHKKGYKNSGVLHLLLCEVLSPKSFVDYLMGGLELMCTFAIDFTGSNGNPQLPSSLHYNNPYQPNMYVQAIQQIGSILMDYDTDKLFPAFGYGGKLPSGAVSHGFALNGNEENPHCQGVEGVLQAYHQAIQSVKLWGPTNFAPVINNVSKFAQASAKSSKNGKEYFVLLILTDGAITDVPATKEAIVRASTLPMSIIIVGVGSADFSTMEMLDGDDGNLVDPKGHRASRDIVQFVPFSACHGNPQTLSQAVLAELPGQVVQYLKDANVQ